MMVRDGSQLFTMVHGGAIVCSGSWWFMMVCGGVMVYGGAIVVRGGS